MPADTLVERAIEEVEGRQRQALREAKRQARVERVRRFTDAVLGREP